MKIMPSAENNKQYRAVIFDLFHTLTSLDSGIASGKGTSAMLGVSRESWNEQLLNNSPDRLRGRLTDPFLIIKKMALQIDPAIDDRTVRRAVETRNKRFRYALVNIDPGVLATLKKLKQHDIRTGLISNADVMEIAAWPDSPLREYIDQAVFSSAVGFIKPEREIFDICIKRLGVDPAEIIYAGDGGSDELRAARKIGMTTVMVTGVIKNIWPERIAPRRQYADYEVEQISGILQILQECCA